ncbi:MAG: class I SAM-dependent methyltransferase [Candidatus Brocadiaceae bacterium]|nr:class I SAM-dependent methyltransferase [Candidatus Brocadiaceae bacterium]
MKGVLDGEYAIARQKKRSHIYRLRRRTYEVIRNIKEFHPEVPNTIIDIGAADGLMLNSLKETFPNAICLGIEYARALIQCNKSKSISLIQGDALSLPIKNNVVDVVIATAIIEHLSDPRKLLFEAFRVLNNNGIFILTTPHPFWENIATGIGHLKKEEHNSCITLKTLRRLLDESGFVIAKAEQFMLSPVGMPFEMVFERILKLWQLNCLFLNQIIVGKKVNTLQ